MRTYGSVKLKDETWHVTGEPHVILRMKRLFAKSDKAQAGVLTISDTPENCRDLLWFLDRYAMEIHHATLKKLKAGSKAYAENILTLEKILAGEYKARKVDLAIPARDYQKLAGELYLKEGSLLLADELGVGKSASAIYSLLDPNTLPSVVVALTHLTRQWKAEIEKFAPQLRTYICKTGKPCELKDKKTGLLPDVVILNYHKLNGWAATLAERSKSVIFDEVQELRHAGSAKYNAAKLIASKVKYRLGASGTPFYNMGGEMFNVVEVLKPGALGSRSEFEREWCVGGDQIANPKAFGSFLREKCIMLRRTRRDVGREIPPQTNVPHFIDCDERAIDAIQGSAAELARIILSTAPAERGDAFKAAGQFDLLVRQATGVAKAAFVADFVRMLVESGEPVIVYAWHRSVYEILLEKLRDLKPVMFTGTESSTQKEAAKQSFIKGETKILLMSLRAGAGLDGLQYVCRTVVYAELDFSPGIHSQATGRVARDGQQHPVTAYYLISEEGSDPVVSDILGVKRQQIEGVINPNQELIEKLQTTSDHVKKLAAHYLENLKKGSAVTKPAVRTEEPLWDAPENFKKPEFVEEPL